MHTHFFWCPGWTHACIMYTVLDIVLHVLSCIHNQKKSHVKISMRIFAYQHYQLYNIIYILYGFIICILLCISTLSYVYIYMYGFIIYIYAFCLHYEHFIDVNVTPRVEHPSRFSPCFIHFARRIEA